MCQSWTPRACPPGGTRSVSPRHPPCAGFPLVFRRVGGGKGERFGACGGWCGGESVRAVGGQWERAVEMTVIAVQRQNLGR